MMKGKEKEALVGEVNHHLVSKIIYLPEDIGSQSSNHNDCHEKSIDNIKQDMEPGASHSLRWNKSGLGLVSLNHEMSKHIMNFLTMGAWSGTEVGIF